MGACKRLLDGRNRREGSGRTHRKIESHWGRVTFAQGGTYPFDVDRFSRVVVDGAEPAGAARVAVDLLQAPGRRDRWRDETDENETRDEERNQCRNPTRMRSGAGQPRH